MADITKPEENPLNFEDFKNENGITYWWASDLMAMLGYYDMASFKKAIDRAMKACISLNIDCLDNFVKEKRNDVDDYKLTRFACYLTVMNADPKKHPAVAAAQVYFVDQTRKFEIILQKSEDFERLTIREEIKEGNKSLMSTASRAGLTDYGRFVNAGYLGLYNMQNWQLASRRNVDKKDLNEYMGRTELAANLFRITQTEEKIKNHNIRGQAALESTHQSVGREVREIILKNTGKAPEQLPIERKIPEVQKELKAGYKKMQQADQKALPKSKKKKPQ
jgi:DNA-damage-inducible protein D